MNIKRNRTLTRAIVVAGSAMVGLGIWAAVINSPSASSAGAVNTTAVNPNFGTNDNFLNQTYVPSGPSLNAPITGRSTGPRLRTRGS